MNTVQKLKSLIALQTTKQVLVDSVKAYGTPVPNVTEQNYNTSVEVINAAYVILGANTEISGTMLSELATVAVDWLESDNTLSWLLDSVYMRLTTNMYLHQLSQLGLDTSGLTQVVMSMTVVLSYWQQQRYQMKKLKMEIARQFPWVKDFMVNGITETKVVPPGVQHAVDTLLNKRTSLAGNFFADISEAITPMDESITIEERQSVWDTEDPGFSKHQLTAVDLRVTEHELYAHHLPEETQPDGESIVFPGLEGDELNSHLQDLPLGLFSRPPTLDHSSDYGLVVTTIYDPETNPRSTFDDLYDGSEKILDEAIVLGESILSEPDYIAEQKMVDELFASGRLVTVDDVKHLISGKLIYDFPDTLPISKPVCSPRVLVLLNFDGFTAMDYMTCKLPIPEHL